MSGLKIQECRSVLDHFYDREKNHAQSVYLRQARNGQWSEYTWQNFAEKVRKLAGWIIEKDLPKGSRIALHSKNCYEWFVVDLAIMMSGHISIPLYPGQSTETLDYILNHAQCPLIFIGRLDFPEVLAEALPADIEKISLYGCELSCKDSFDQIIERQQPLSENPRPDIDQVFTIMYTSGTTGNPKGVMHSFRTADFAISGMLRHFPYTEHDHFISYLPLAHAAERVTVELLSLYSGAQVNFAENLDTFISNLQDVQPTLFFSVPRLWMKFKEGIESKLSPEKLNLLLSIPLVSTLIKKKIRKQLGLSRANHILSGAASLSADVILWYRRLGINIREGYGMTENLAYGCIAQGDQIVPGTVGKPMPDIEVKISDQGEVLFKTQSMMLGYYLAPEATSDVITNDWYSSGDMGEWDDQGNLKITGRLKETFKTLRGKFVSPVPIESMLAELSELSELCLLGSDMLQPVLLVRLSELGWKQTPETTEVRLMERVELVNGKLSKHERIMQTFIISEEWTAENDLMTPTMKLKRHKIDARYRSWIESNNEGNEIIWQKEPISAEPEDTELQSAL